MTTMLIPGSVVSESHLQAAMSQLIEESQHFDGLEQRQHARYPYFRPVTITLDHGERHVSGLTRDITRFNIAMIYRSQGKLPEAVEELRKVVQLDEQTHHPDLESDRAALAQVEQELREQ